jgi:hypothetical protein
VTSLGKNETITEINAHEFNANGGKESVKIIALLRLNCLATDSATIIKWTGDLKKSTLIQTALAIRNTGTGILCSSVIDDVYLRLLGRHAYLDKCDAFDKQSDSFDCKEIQNLAQGFSTIFEFIHNARSKEEYIMLNQSAKCQQISDQYNPHSIGEYVGVMFNVALGRRPTKPEMNKIIAGYYQGDTRAILSQVGLDLQSGKYNVPLNV